MMENSVFDNLIHEVETAETKLKSLNASSVRKTSVGSEAKLLEEEIGLLIGEDGDSGLHFYTVVGEIEKQVSELRKLSEMTKLSVENNTVTLENLNKMVEEQRVVVANFEKETGKETPMEETQKTVSKEAGKLHCDIGTNREILEDLKSLLRDLVDSRMRTETESGPSCGVGQLLQLLWRQFVTAGPDQAVLELSQLGFKADDENVQQLVQSGIVTLDGEHLKLVNFFCEK